VFWAASQAARRAALQTEREVTLSYDSKEKRFAVGDGGRDAAQYFAIPGATRDLTVELLPGQERSGGGSILIGGQLLENRTIGSVTYYPDGTCAPFRVQFRTNGPARVIAIDPWTCAPMLAPKEGTP
jgi:general secretion pathway protein H